MQKNYSIRELSSEFGVTTRTLRFYEEKGLLSPTRNGVNRIYTAADRARLVLILRGKRLGLSLEESSDLISMYDRETDNKEQLQTAIDTFREKRLQLQQQKQELQKMIADLKDYEERYLAVLNGDANNGKAKIINGKTG